MAATIDGACMALLAHPTGDPYLSSCCTRPAGHEGPHPSELKNKTWED